MPDPDDGIVVTLTQAEKDAQYTRSVNAFWCPVCSLGHQRPIVASQTKPYHEWLYECDHCQATGTKAQLNNSAFYAANIAPRTCPICGDHIRPAADHMAGDWWMQPSHTQTWWCAGCSFVGNFRNFADEADRQLVTMPDFESVPAF